MARNPASGAGVAMAGAAGAAGAVATGAAVGTGFALAHVLRRLKQGDLGWDRDGNFVCSEFMFNPKTMEVFDGEATYPASDVLEANYVNGVVVLSLRGKAEPRKIAVQTDRRGEVVLNVLGQMWSGNAPERDGGEPLPSFSDRVHRVTGSHFVRYFFRSLVVGVALGGFTVSLLDVRNGGGFVVLGFAAAAFGLSVWRRLKRDVKAPAWS